MSKVGQLYPENENKILLPLKEDIHRFISSTELFLSNNRGLRYTGLKKVNFFVGHPVGKTVLSLAMLVLHIWFELALFFIYPARHLHFESLFPVQIKTASTTKFVKKIMKYALISN